MRLYSELVNEHRDCSLINFYNTVKKVGGYLQMCISFFLLKLQFTDVRLGQSTKLAAFLYYYFTASQDTLQDPKNDRFCEALLEVLGWLFALQD